MKSKTQDKKRLNAVGMRICALFAVLAVVFAAFMTTVPHALASETGNPASVKGKTYKIGTDTTFAPFEYRENGKMTGIDMELIRGIAKEEGFKVEIQSLGFNAALQALSSNQVDVVIAGMSITDERKASYDFSNPYFQSGIQMAVAANNDDVTGYKDLKGRTVVAKTGSEGESYAKQHADKYGYKVTSVDQSSTMYEMVKSGNAVAVFDDYPVLAYGVSQNNGLKIVTPKVPHGEYGMAVNKGMNADLLAAINDGLNKMIASGEYERIVAQYLGKQGAKEQAKSISGMITDNGDDSAEQQKVGFLGLVKQSMPALLTGLRNTLLITLLSFAIALVLGVAFGLMKVSESKIAAGLANVYIAVFRGTPILVWAFFFYFGVPQLIGHSVNIWVAGALTLSLNSGAYLAEIVRGAVQSVDSGQMEGARSLGLNHRQAMRRVILPQAIKNILPALGNEFIVMIKEASLASVFFITEITSAFKTVQSATFITIPALMISGILYLALTTVLSFLMKLIEGRLKAND